MNLLFRFDWIVLLDVDEVIVPRFVEMIVLSIYLLVYLPVFLSSIYLSTRLSTHSYYYDPAKGGGELGGDDGEGKATCFS